LVKIAVSHLLHGRQGEKARLAERFIASRAAGQHGQAQREDYASCVEHSHRTLLLGSHQIATRESIARVEDGSQVD
jgi:hypothetical protein